MVTVRACAKLSAGVAAIAADAAVAAPARMNWRRETAIGVLRI
jgi:hypothetical protein